MAAISSKLEKNLEKGSWIRKLFEEGRRLKEIYGEHDVFDFSLGNPIVDPPQEFIQILRKIVANETPGTHGYIPNQGLYETRKNVAEYLHGRFEVEFTSDTVVMTVGAGGALNVVLKSILNEGEEVIILTPYFVEYDYYVENCGGNIVHCPLADDFSINMENVSRSITKKTKAIIVNTPHNPTGTVLSQDNLNKLGKLLAESEKLYGNEIYILYDDPYGQLSYDVTPPNPFKAYHRTIFVSSFSKDLGIAGERLGYIALSTDIQDSKSLIAAFTFSNRTLGFVNGPVTMQRVISQMSTLTNNQDEYKVRRDKMISVLQEAGFDFVIPQGGFFIFPKSPLEDDVQFCLTAAKQFKLLLVPGSGFGRKGHFRISFSVPIEQIERSSSVFKELMEYIKKC